MGLHVTIQRIFVYCVNSVEMGSCGTFALSIPDGSPRMQFSRWRRKFQVRFLFALSVSSASPVMNIFDIKSEADLSDSIALYSVIRKSVQH
jgi:hypothetical protein